MAWLGSLGWYPVGTRPHGGWARSQDREWLVWDLDSVTTLPWHLESSFWGRC